jgi:hypothetical protein
VRHFYVGAGGAVTLTLQNPHIQVQEHNTVFGVNFFGFGSTAKARDCALHRGTVEAHK